jgi:UDP-glucuronate decarboxylase
MASDDEFTGPASLGNPHECTVLELAELIVERTNSRSEIRFAPLPSDDPTRGCPDITLAKAMLHWQPRVPLREGLRKILEYFDRLSSSRVTASPRAAGATG